jgi:hypothetical protein
VLRALRGQLTLMCRAHLEKRPRVRWVVWSLPGWPPRARLRDIRASLPAADHPNQHSSAIKPRQMPHRPARRSSDLPSFFYRQFRNMLPRSSVRNTRCPAAIRRGTPREMPIWQPSSGSLVTVTVVIVQSYTPACCSTNLKSIACGVEDRRCEAAPELRFRRDRPEQYPIFPEFQMPAPWESCS